MTTLTSPPMRSAVQSGTRLQEIEDRVRAGYRLSIDEGLALYEAPDVWWVCRLADVVRRKLHGDIAWYNINRHLNYTNICALSCKFCAFYRKRGDEGAYEHSLEEIREEALKAIEAGATEIHIVGGLHPWLPFDYYLDMMRTIHAAAPDLHIKAFTAVEIVHLARIAQRARDGYEGIKSVLRDLKEAGLGSLPGGGAETFDDRVHDEAFKGKIRSDKWLEVHRAAHEIGLNTNATILYGHIESRMDRLVHMDMLRRAQDVALARLGYEADQRTRVRGHEVTEESGPPTHEWRGEITLTRPGVALPKFAVASGGDTPCRRASVPRGQSGCFQTIIPLPFIPDDSELEHLPGPGGLENLRTLAICRLMLDNFPHVKAFWIMQTLPMAQLMLQSGADDIDGTVVWYDITKVGGATTHQEMGVKDLCRAIREAGFRPIERDTQYRPVVRDGGTWRVATTA